MLSFVVLLLSLPIEIKLVMNAELNVLYIKKKKNPILSSSFLLVYLFSISTYTIRNFIRCRSSREHSPPQSSHDRYEILHSALVVQLSGRNYPNFRLYCFFIAHRINTFFDHGQHERTIQRIGQRVGHKRSQYRY